MYKVEAYHEMNMSATLSRTVTIATRILQN
jgi:hypothetical protein